MKEGKLVHMTLDGIQKAVSKYGTFPLFHHGGLCHGRCCFSFQRSSKSSRN